MPLRPGLHAARGVARKEPATMDNLLMIIFGAVIVMNTALSFMELHRIRKTLEGKRTFTSEKASALQPVRPLT